MVGLCLARSTHVGVPGAPHHCAPLTRAELDRARPVRASMVAALNPKAWLAFGGGLQGEGGARVVGLCAVAAAMHACTAERALDVIRENARQFTAHYGVPWASYIALKLAAAAMAKRRTEASRRTAHLFAHAAGELVPPSGAAPRRPAPPYHCGPLKRSGRVSLPPPPHPPKFRATKSHHEEPSSPRARLTPPRRFHDDRRSRSFSRSSPRSRPKRFRAA